MKLIPLTQNKVAIVDDEDFEALNRFQWQANRGHTGKWYAQRKVVHPLNGTQLNQKMHRELMGLAYGDPREVDHIDRVNTLDNRRLNLRVVTHRQNTQNAGLRKDASSGFKGVGWYKSTETWRARIRSEGKRVNLGYFSTAELAAQAYDKAAIAMHGEFACTNLSLGLLP